MRDTTQAAFILLGALVFALWLGREDAAQRECETRHSFETCFYALNR